jgi:RNA polymerase-binding transcription factor
MAHSTKRQAELRQMLTGRRREMRSDVQSRIRARRTDRLKDVGDHLDDSDADVQGDIDLALLQMRAETVARIDALLVRLDAGQYGHCVECEQAIAERRLRALPFALRCQTCEQKREQKHETGRLAAKKASSFWLFPEVAGS